MQSRSAVDRTSILYDEISFPFDDTPVRRQAASTLVMLLTCALVTGGCANDSDRTRAEGAGAGAVIGGTLGALLGHGKAGGIAAGAAAGGIAGGLYGNHVANKKEAYATQEDQLRASAAHAQQVATQTHAYNQQLQLQIAALEQNRDRLKHQVVSADKRNQLMLDDKRKTTALIDQTKAQLASVQQEISNQQKVLRLGSTGDANADQQSASLRKVSTGIDDLQTQARDLDEGLAQLRMIDQRRAY